MAIERSQGANKLSTERLDDSPSAWRIRETFGRAGWSGRETASQPRLTRPLEADHSQRVVQNVTILLMVDVHINVELLWDADAYWQAGKNGEIDGFVVLGSGERSH